MKKTINFYDFVQAFADAGRTEQFSREALASIFDYIEQAERDAGEELELDVIAICCDFTEATPQDIIKDYDINPADHEDEFVDDGLTKIVLEYLWDNTQAFELDNGKIVYVNF